MSRRAARPAGPVTPGTDQLVGAWSRADAGRASSPSRAGSDTPPDREDTAASHATPAAALVADPATPAAAMAADPATPVAAPDVGADTATPSDGATAPRRTGGPTRSGRRVTTAAVPGSDPTPAPEPARHGAGENDDRLLRDRPPHWG